MYYADKRQQFLIDQGYSFQVVQEMPYSRELKDPIKREKLPFHFAIRKYQKQLLQDITNKKEAIQTDDEGDVESDEGQEYLNAENAKLYTGAHGTDIF